MPEHHYRRIALIGPPGAGKSHLAAQLATRTGLALFHLDRQFWRAGWVAMPREDWQRHHADLIARPDWIIDGNYAGTLPERAARADLVVLLDYPLWRCLWGVLRRWWMYRGVSRPDMTPGCPERVDLKFLLYVWRFRRNERPRTLAAIEAAAETIILRSPSDTSPLLSRFLPSRRA